MNPHQINADGKIGLVSPPGGADVSTDLAIVKLDTLAINQLTTGGKAGKQGAIAISVNGQSTSLSWATDGHGALKNSSSDHADPSGNKFGRQILYFGTPKGLLDMTVQVMQTHDDVVKKLNEAKSFLGMGAAIAGFFPGTGTAVGAGLDVLGAIVDLVSGANHNNLELYAGASLGKLGGNPDDPTFRSLRPGQYVVSRKDAAGQSAIEVGFTVCEHRLPDWVTAALAAANAAAGDGHDKPPAPQVAIVLEKLDMELPDAMEGRTLVFDSTFGTDKNVASYHFEALVKDGVARIDDVAGLFHKPVYYGPWTGGVPFSLSLAGTRKDELAALDGIVAKGGAFAKVRTSDKDVQSEIDTATKAAQSMRAFISEFLPDKLSVGTMSGFIAEGQCLDPALTGLENFRVVDLRNKNVWTPFSLTLHSQTGGKADLAFRIKAV